MGNLLERLRTPLYLVAALFIITPCVDIVANVMPLHFNTMQWRFGATGVASNYLISIVFGAALAAVVAIGSGTRATLIGLGVLGLLAAAGLLVAGIYLVLDMTQLAREVPPESLNPFHVGGWKTFFKLVSTALVLGAIALAELRASTTKARAESAAFLMSQKA